MHSITPNNIILSANQTIDKPQENIWPIAWVSFFWSTASLMVFAILPVFLSEELKISHKAIGLLEGVAIATAFATKIFSGIASDFFRRRKLLIIIGSLMSVLTKPLFAIATTSTMIFYTRFIDRLAKGVRAAPTDALIANISHNDTATHNYSIRQALYALGTVCGSVIAMLLMWNSSNFRFVFLLATIPALIALVLLYFSVSDPKIIKQKTHLQWKLTDMLQLPKVFWMLLVVTGILMMARFSEMFMVLKAKEIGWSIKYLPLIMITIDFFHAGAAFINKKLADKFGDINLLILGFLLLIAANITFSISKGWLTIGIGIILNGIHMGITQGLLRSMIAKTCSQHLIGTAFSLFYLISGLGVLLGNLVAGSLADSYGLYATFIGGMLATTAAMIICVVIRTTHENSLKQLVSS